MPTVSLAPAPGPALRVNAGPGDDWIVEGLAEFYALETLRRSGTITPSRYERSYDQLRDWSDDVDDLPKRRSRGAITACAVLVMRRLDEEIREETDNDENLDDVASESDLFFATVFRLWRRNTGGRPSRQTEATRQEIDAGHSFNWRLLAANGKQRSIGAKQDQAWGE